MGEYPEKTGKCEISGCKNTPTDWHHVISQGQIKKRGLPYSYYTDRGNLKEYCREHHDMTTASMARKYLTKDKRTNKSKRKKVPKKKRGEVGYVITEADYEKWGDDLTGFDDVGSPVFD